jgi:hypothetical protein
MDKGRHVQAEPRLWIVAGGRNSNRTLTPGFDDQPGEITAKEM